MSEGKTEPTREGTAPNGHWRGLACLGVPRFPAPRLSWLLGIVALWGLLGQGGCSSVNTQQNRNSAGYAARHGQQDKGILNLGSLFDKKEPDPPKTVNEWMKLPRSDI